MTTHLMTPMPYAQAQEFGFNPTKDPQIQSRQFKDLKIGTPFPFRERPSFERDSTIQSRLILLKPHVISHRF